MLLAMPVWLIAMTMEKQLKVIRSNNVGLIALLLVKS